MLSTRSTPIAAPDAAGVAITPSPTEGVALDTLPALLAWSGLMGLLLLGPYFLSGFWPSTYDFWPQSLFLLLWAVVALLLMLTPGSMPRFDGVAICWLGFLGWSVLATLPSVYRHDSYLELARVGGAFSVFFVVRALCNTRRVVWLVGAWCIGMAWVCLPALLDFTQTHNPRQPGPFYNTNLFANALAMTLPIALVWPFLVRRLHSGVPVALSALAFLLSALGLIVTSSKGGFLAALLALIVTSALILWAKKSEFQIFARRHRIPLGVGATLFCIAFAILATKTILPRLNSARGSDDNSTMFRVFIWRSTLDMVKARPLVGFGPASFASAYPRYAQTGYTRSAHESWLQVAAENGLPALLLLATAVILAMKASWQRARSQDWPVVAGAMGAVVALLVHGCVDSGFQTTSIVILLSVTLALLAPVTPPRGDSASRLNPFWLGVTLLLALGGFQSQKASSGEMARFNSMEFSRNGAPGVAVQKAGDAIDLDPGSARLWSNLGGLQARNNTDPRAAFQTAATLQPTRGSHFANLARAAQTGGASPRQVDNLYGQALQQDPLNTNLLLERAIWRLQTKDGRGYDDLNRIITLWDAPYGRYPALTEWVNLDFARAVAGLAPHLAALGQKGRAVGLIKRALDDCTRARRYQAGNEAVLRESGGEFGMDDNADLETLAAQLDAIERKLG